MALKQAIVWLGGLFTPEAYITATRQYVAQANSWSLEELSIKIDVYDNIKMGKLDECSFPLVGLKLQGKKRANFIIKFRFLTQNKTIL
jgi:dynein heavy chain 1